MTSYFAGSHVYAVFQRVRGDLMAGFVFPGMHLETKAVAVI